MSLATMPTRPADYLRRHAAARPRPPGALAALSERGAAAFGAKGFPTQRDESWHYTSLTPLLGTEFSADAAPMPVDRARLPGLLQGREAQHRLVFVNGALRADLSAPGTLPAGVELSGLVAAAQQRPALLEAGNVLATELAARPLAALNAALLGDGFVLRLADGVVLDAPLEILWIGTGAERPPLYHPRNAIVLGAGAHATVVEHHVGLCIGSYFSNSVTEITLGRGAVLRHCKVQDEARESFHLALTAARLAEAAQFDSFVFSLGSRLARNEIEVRLEGARAHCRLNGAYLARGDQHLDHTTVIDHAAPETTSKELYKGVLDGRARGVFQGKIVVRRGAQKADGQQLSRALLLSDRAEIDAKPELEILADDVKCGHGATVGELDAAALFYLRSRGIPEIEARRILIEAFVGEVIGSVALSGMRMSLERNLERWMAGPR
jgi:Fe-S cluster assembly protein SufD